MNTINKKIKELATKQGLTIRNVVDSVGMTENGYYAAIRNGSLRVDKLQKIANLLNTPVSLLLSESETESETDTKLTKIVVSTQKNNDKNLLFDSLLKEKDARIEELKQMVEFMQGALLGEIKRIGSGGGSSVPSSKSENFKSGLPSQALLPQMLGGN